MKEKVKKGELYTLSLEEFESVTSYLRQYSNFLHIEFAKAQSFSTADFTWNKILMIEGFIVEKKLIYTSKEVMEMNFWLIDFANTILQKYYLFPDKDAKRLAYQNYEKIDSFLKN